MGIIGKAVGSALGSGVGSFWGQEGAKKGAHVGYSIGEVLPFRKGGKVSLNKSDKKKGKTKVVISPLKPLNGLGYASRGAIMRVKPM